VCSLIHYTRSWSSDRKDPHELGAQQLAWWAKGVGRAMEFRKKFGDDRFVDVSFADLQTEPVEALAGALERVGFPFDARSRSGVEAWARSHEPGAHGTHTYELSDFGLHPDQIRERFDLSILLIEHHMQVVMGICDRMYVLDYGITIAQGGPDAIKRDPKVIEAYLPKAAGEEEIVAGVKAAIAEMTPPPAMKDMGTVMKAAMARLSLGVQFAVGWAWQWA